MTLPRLLASKSVDSRNDSTELFLFPICRTAAGCRTELFTLELQELDFVQEGHELSETHNTVFGFGMRVPSWIQTFSSSIISRRLILLSPTLKFSWKLPEA